MKPLLGAALLALLPACARPDSPAAWERRMYGPEASSEYIACDKAAYELERTAVTPAEQGAAARAAAKCVTDEAERRKVREAERPR